MDLQRMINYILRNRKTFTPNTRRYSCSQQVYTISSANVCIEYPGRKQSGDYSIKFSNNIFNNKAIFYSDDVKELYDMVISNHNLFNEYYTFVIDVVKN